MKDGAPNVSGEDEREPAVVTARQHAQRGGGVPPLPHQKRLQADKAYR